MLPNLATLRVQMARTGATPDLPEDNMGLVLRRIEAGDAEDACRMAASWVAITRTHSQAGRNVEDAWEELIERFFGPSDRLPRLDFDPRGQFYSLCERTRTYRTGVYRLSYPASPEDPNVETFVRAAMTFSPNAYKDASVRIRSDPEFVLAAVAQQGSQILYSQYPAILSNREIIYAASRTFPEALLRATEEIQTDRDFVIRLIQQNAHSFSWSRFRTDEEVALVAVRKDGRVLSSCADGLRTEPRVVLAAVTQNYKAVQAAGVDNDQIYAAYMAGYRHDESNDQLDNEAKRIHNEYMSHRRWARNKGSDPDKQTVVWRLL